MKEISNKFFIGLIGLSFVLGLMLSLNYEAIAYLVGRPVVSADNNPINSGSSTIIRWVSTGADGCGVITVSQTSTLTPNPSSFVGAGGSNTSGNFNTGTLTNSTSSAQTITFTVRCSVVDAPPPPPTDCSSYYQVPLSPC